MGQSLPNPVLSSLEHFKDEYEAHIKERRCPAGECKALITYSIDEEKCTGCTLCAKKCPEEAVTSPASWPLFCPFMIYNTRMGSRDTAVDYERIDTDMWQLPAEGKYDGV